MRWKGADVARWEAGPGERQGGVASTNDVLYRIAFTAILSARAKGLDAGTGVQGSQARETEANCRVP